MGLIRKSLNIATAGAVKDQSKKQKYARTAVGIPSLRERSAAGWRSLAPRSAEQQPQKEPPSASGQYAHEQFQARVAAAQHDLAVGTGSRGLVDHSMSRTVERTRRWDGLRCAVCGGVPELLLHDLLATPGGHTFIPEEQQSG